MGKIIFITVTILFSVSCVAQQKVVLNDAVSVSLPNKTTKITKDQALTHSHERFNDDPILTDDIARNTSAYIYKVDDIIVSLYPYGKNLNLKPGYLLSLKKGFDEIAHGDTSYKSNLKMINKNSVLILRNGYNNTGAYHFYCNNSANTHAITGKIQFNRKDEKEAKTILDDLLNSIQFKDE